MPPLAVGAPPRFCPVAPLHVRRYFRTEALTVLGSTVTTMVSLRLQPVEVSVTSSI